MILCVKGNRLLLPPAGCGLNVLSLWTVPIVTMPAFAWCVVREAIYVRWCGIWDSVWEHWAMLWPCAGHGLVLLARTRQFLWILCKNWGIVNRQGTASSLLKLFCKTFRCCPWLPVRLLSCATDGLWLCFIRCPHHPATASHTLETVALETVKDVGDGDETVAVTCRGSLVALVKVSQGRVRPVRVFSG